MALPVVRELREPRSGGIDQAWQRGYTRTWQVDFDDPHWGALAARTAIPVVVGNRYTTGSEYDNGAFCQSIKAECTGSDDGCTWIVTAEYGPYDANRYPADPTQHTPSIKFSFAQFDEDVDLDQAGRPVVNSAGDSFDPGVRRDDSRPVIEISRNEVTFDALLVDQYQDAVNAGPFLGYEPGTVKVYQIGGELQFSPDIGFYWTVSYAFHVKSEGWKKRVLDQGLRQISSGKRVPILANGVPVTDPVPLDGGGRPLAVGGTPQVLEFEVYPSLDFSVFNLDDYAALFTPPGTS
jgi:hypothetical protein